MEDIRMAKELGISPRSLMKNNPSKSQQWKLPVKLWIRELYDKMLERREAKQARKQQAHSGASAAPRQVANEVTAAPGTKRVEPSDQSCLVGDLMDEAPTIQIRALPRRCDRAFARRYFILKRLDRITACRNR
jgi:hypothetical protein